ncbi:cuticle protein 10.6-like, partial [Nilaparvata lugens]|uniref:cuticle protein 10.6-like n=1 Tax=Nilaparvata lugens TaxID=108931 RepID=UPI00193EB64A
RAPCGGPLPVYGAHYAPAHYGHAPIVKTVSSVAVAHTPVAHSYSNTYKVSHPVLKVPYHHAPIVKYSAPIIKTYAAPYYSAHGLYDYPYGYGHGYGHGYDYPLLYSKYLH